VYSSACDCICLPIFVIIERTAAELWCHIDFPRWLPGVMWAYFLLMTSHIIIIFKRTILARKQVVWALKRENRFGGLSFVLSSLASCLTICTALSGTPPYRRRQLLDWLHKPLPNIWLVASQYAFRWQAVRISVLFWVRSFIEPDLFDHNVPFDNTTPIYLISLPWKLELRLGLDLKLHHFSIFHGK